MTRARARGLIALTAALAVICALPASAGASPGELDTSFGHLGNGTVFADEGRGDAVVKVLRQSDGKILTVATALGPDQATALIVVARYLANGSVDTAFGDNGRVAYTNGSGTVSDAVMQPDGKIVIVGSTSAPSDFLVMRLRTDGSIDPTFVHPSPHAAVHFPGTRSDEAQGVALGLGGTIVVAGHADENVAIARYTSTGVPDPTFSGDGLLTHDFGGPSNATDVVVQPDGKIIVGGNESIENESLPRPVVARFNTNGSLDPTFGTGGRARAAGTPLRSGQVLNLQGNKVLVAGIIDTHIGGIVRYKADGTLDRTFGSSGTAIAHVGFFLRFTDLTADASGRLIAAGESAFSDGFPDVETLTSVWRFSSDGKADASFGCGGKSLTQVLGNGLARIYNASGALSALTVGNDIVVGGFATSFNGTDFPPRDDLIARYDGDGPHTSGYALLGADGGTTAFGGAPACGSPAGTFLFAPIVATAFDPVAPGNWSVDTQGTVFNFGAAGAFGSMTFTHLTRPIVGMAAAPDGKGYWLVAGDGGVFAFGSAGFFGSTGAIRLNQPIVGMAAAKDGKGYWLVAGDGGVFAFGSARFAGSTGNIRLNQPVVGMAADPDGTGYWLVASDGGVFAFDAHFSGSTGAFRIAQPVVGIAADPDGKGYWMGARDGGVFSFDAQYHGSTAVMPFANGGTIGIAAAP